MFDPNNLYSLLDRGGLLAVLVFAILAIVLGFIVPRSSYLEIIALWAQQNAELKVSYAKLETRYDDMKAVATENTKLYETLVEILEILEAPSLQRRGRAVRLRRKLGVRR